MSRLLRIELSGASSEGAGGDFWVFLCSKFTQPADCRILGFGLSTAGRDKALEDPMACVTGGMIFVAVSKEVEKCRSNLVWALDTFRGKRFFILHVHQPAKRIPGGCKSLLMHEHVCRPFICRSCTWAFVIRS